MLIKTLTLHSLTCLVGITGSMAVQQVTPSPGTGGRFQSSNGAAAIITQQIVDRSIKSDRLPIEQAKLQTDDKAPLKVPAQSMVTIQLRHIKLWSAGKSKNWDLLNYEAQKLEDDFIAAAGFYRNLPVDNLVLVDRPLQRLMEAAKEKDYSLYTKAFDELTAGCNSCHVAGQVGFIHIQLPKSSPFSDQSYER